jgi:hypothetical protein
MELVGDVRIEAPRARVWAALNDPSVLARCIDGVQRLEPAGDNRFEGAMKASVGPVRASFTGSVAITETDPPSRYVLVGEGRGGVAGFVKGSAEVTLEPLDGETTLLRYVARSQVGGRLAQLGARLIEGAARGYADTFFTRLKTEVESPAALSVPEPLPAADAPGASPTLLLEGDAPAVPQPGGVPPLLWIGVLLAGVGLLLYLLLA